MQNSESESNNHVFVFSCANSAWLLLLLPLFQSSSLTLFFFSLNEVLRHYCMTSPAFSYYFLIFSKLFLNVFFRVRFHYGHPDVFDRVFHITRGGISKASKTINLSEDVYAGKNKWLDSVHTVEHCWYVNTSYG